MSNGGSEEGEDEYVSDQDVAEEDDDESESEKEVKFTVKQAPVNEYLLKREATLICLLKKSFKSRVIIFCNEKLQVTRLMSLLSIFGFNAAEVQGNMTQDDRLQAVEAF